MRKRCESRVCPRVHLAAMGCDTHLGTLSSPGSGTDATVVVATAVDAAEGARQLVERRR
jgi:hypothetical protein